MNNGRYVVSVFLAFCIFCSMAQGLFALKGTIASTRSSFRACYLTSKDLKVNYAILYKGLSVEVIGGSATSRWQVRINPRDRKVVKADGWSGARDAKYTGWVSTKYLKVARQAGNETSEQTGGQSSDVSSNTDENNGTNTAGTSQTNSGSSHYQEIRLFDVSAGEGAMVNDSEGEGESNGSESGIYYVFSGTGEEEDWFAALAQNKPIAGEGNYVYKHVRRDVAETGGRCEGIVVVKVGDPRKVMDILSNSRVPMAPLSPLPSGRGRLPIYEPDTLVDSTKKILGFCFVSHSGSDGPLINFHDHKGVQLHYKYFMRDFFNAVKLNSSEPTFYSRLVNNCRITLAGCNSGNCQYYNGKDPSLSHYLAWIYSSKNIVVRGKTAAGSPNAPDRRFAKFGKNGEQVVTRLFPDKKDYKLLINVPTNRYDSYSVPYSSQAELNELLAFYRARDITVKVRRGSILVRSPRWLRGKWLTRKTPKDNVLKTVLYAMSTRKLKAYTARAFYAMMNEPDPSELARTRKMMPRLEELMNDAVLQSRIEINKKNNNGKLDIDAYELWEHIYFGNMSQEELRENRWSLPLRACLCHDKEEAERYEVRQ